MNQCKDCKHYEVIAYGICERITEYSRNDNGPMARLDVTVDDDSNLNASLFVSPDFGCILWEAKK